MKKIHLQVLCTVTVGQNKMHFLDFQKLGVFQRALQYLLVELGDARHTILEHRKDRNRIDQIEFGQALALLAGTLECFLPFVQRVLVRRLAFDGGEFGAK